MLVIFNIFLSIITFFIFDSKINFKIEKTAFLRKNTIYRDFYD